MPPGPGPGPIRTFARLTSSIRPVSCRRCFSSAPGHLPPLSLLEHRHLTGPDPDGLVAYDYAEAVQEDLRARLLSWKSLPDTADPPPRPHLLSFEATPTFTLGRRQDALTPEQTARLRAPLAVSLPGRAAPRSFTPDVRNTNRGGLTTYHGPGQLVLWPVLDMRSPLHAPYSVLSYAGHLEATTQRFLATLFGVETYTRRDEPGVWVRELTGSDGPERKIAAMGVHHRRHVTALGIAVNIDIAVTGGEAENPWARFVPCGLEGKLVTSAVAEGGHLESGWTMAGLAARWANMFEEGLQDASLRGGDTSFRKAV